MANLNIVVALTDAASAGLRTLGNNLSGLGTVAIVAGGAMATAMAGIAAAAIKGAADVQQAVANISTIKPEIDTSVISSQLNEISTRVPQTAKQLSDGLYNIFSSLEIGSEDALSLVEKLAKGATGAGTDVEKFGTSVIGVMNAYGLSVSDADHITDVFFNTVNKGVISGDELAASLGPVTQSAKLASVSLDELGGLIAGVTKEGGPAAQNVNNLNNLLGKITTKEATKALSDFGIASYDASGKFRPIMDVMGDLKRAMDDLPEAGRAQAIQKIFPDLQAKTAAATIMSQLDFINGAIDANINQAGSAESAYKKMSATVSAQFTLMKNTGQAALNEIGAVLLPFVASALAGLATLTPHLQTFTKSLASIVGLLTEGDPEKRIAMFNQLAGVFGPQIAEGIALVTSGIIGIFGAISGNEDGISRFQNALVGLFGPETTAQIMQFVGLFQQVIGWIQQMAAVTQEAIAPLFGMVDGMTVLKIVAVGVGLAVVAAVTSITLIIAGLATVIAGTAAAYKLGFETIQGAIESAREKVDAFAQAFGSVNFATLLTKWKDDLVAGFNGMIKAAQDKVQELRNLLPSSPAKTGPLSVPVNWAWLFEGMPKAATDATKATQGALKAGFSLRGSAAVAGANGPMGAGVGYSVYDVNATGAVSLVGGNAQPNWATPTAAKSTGTGSAKAGGAVAGSVNVTVTIPSGALNIDGLSDAELERLGTKVGGYVLKGFNDALESRLGGTE